MAVYNQDKFQFGVCAHNPSHGCCTGYPKRMMTKHLELARDLGVKLYRVDVSRTDDEWLDELVRQSADMGLELMLIVYDADYAGIIAERYRGKIRYYQVLNEIDCGAFKKVPGQPDASGRKISHFDEEKLEAEAERCRRIIAALRSGDPDARICINGTWMHYGMIDYMLQNGVEFDVLGWDWYSNMEAGYGIESCVEDLLKYGKDVLFCETNIWPHTHTDKDRADYICGLMDFLYNHPSQRVIGMIVYELLDEHGHSVESERSFGLVETDDDCNIIKVKDAYTAMQKLLK